MPTPSTDPDELLNELNKHRGELSERMGIVLTEASAQRVTATMPVAGNRQPYGLLHGGASVVLAETVGSVASMLTAQPGRIAVGIEINATHHRAATDGTVTAVATRIHAGSTLATYDIRITDEAGRPVCTCRLTCMLRDRPPGSGSVPG
ncbi:PaaI family thioesterase [Parafrankia sp. EUN1f]|uniref:PaaI family thioesterase n=1 Tax=Parafrankia sp. EUN1f TaxID=102897 RepID=UPI0001C43F45|nr:hotdog fold thioesterase [Parafrankia sp. EUN1f]EFC83023.1 thioesterase superfamily protein [Parafrankia sp. EUN1f]